MSPLLIAFVMVVLMDNQPRGRGVAQERCADSSRLAVMEGDHINALFGQPGGSRWSDLLPLGAEGGPGASVSS